jgi:hypothetical protein
MAVIIFMPDDRLESRIEAAAQRLRTAPSLIGRRAAWEEMRRLIRMRSYEQVQKMEHQKGLR